MGGVYCGDHGMHVLAVWVCHMRDWSVDQCSLIIEILLHRQCARVLYRLIKVLAAKT